MLRVAKLLLLLSLAVIALAEPQERPAVPDGDDGPDEPLTAQEIVEERAEEEGAVVTENKDGSYKVQWAHEEEGPQEALPSAEASEQASVPSDTATAAAEAPAQQAKGVPSQSQVRQARGARKRRGGKGNKRCKVPGCSVCTRADRMVCETCRRGFVLNGEGKCDPCMAGCNACTSTDTCDHCKAGFTLVNGVCQACAAHCLKCDQAGPGGCNECGKRRMLDVRLEPHGEGEVHKCVPCGDGCAACSMEEGCTSCDSFYSMLPHGQGCAFSWFRIWLVFGVIIAVVGICIFACVEDIDPHGSAYDAYTTTYGRDRHPHGSWMEGKKYDDGTRVVQKSRNDSGTEVRQRGQQRAETSPQREQPKIFTPMPPPPGAGMPELQRHHSLPGYT